MHGSVLGWFVGGALQPSDIEDHNVIEVGSFNVNGSVRPHVKAMDPASYVGVDIIPGLGVDQIVSAVDLVSIFGPNSFDVVISTEMLEHAEDWQAAIRNMVEILRPGGVLIFTTRSVGFAYHNPPDHWRYTLDSARQIVNVAGLDADMFVDDPEFPGIFVKAYKPRDWQQPDWSNLGNVTGITPMTEPLKIMGLAGRWDGTAYYRLYMPLEYMARSGQVQCKVPPPGTIYEPTDDEVESNHVLVSQSMIQRSWGKRWKSWKGLTSRICDIDDDLTAADSSQLPLYENKEVCDVLTETLSESDMVTVSTPYLREKLLKYNPNIVVLPNHIDAGLLQVERPQSEKLTIGWTAGSTHLLDAVYVTDPLVRILDENSDVDFHMMGQDFSPIFRRKARFTNWIRDPFNFFQKMDFDIGIAPLADVEFNRSKSHNKALEYNALGIPVVATDMEPYREYVIDGENGFLVSTHQEWHDRINDLIHDEELRITMGKRAREMAAQHTMQTSGWLKWYIAYETLARPKTADVY